MDVVDQFIVNNNIYCVVNSVRTHDSICYFELVFKSINPLNRFAYIFTCNIHKDNIEVGQIKVNT